MSPTSIVQATADHEPIIFDALEFNNPLVAKSAAVANPKTILITAEP